jgi:hypothetical protein
MREVVMERIRDNWIDNDEYSTGDALDLSLNELDNLTNEELLDVLIEMVQFSG